MQIFIRISVTSAPEGEDVRGFMVTGLVERLDGELEFYQNAGKARFMVGMWIDCVRVNGVEVDGEDPPDLAEGDELEISDSGGGVWRYAIAEIGPLNSLAFAVATCRSLLAGNVPESEIPAIERGIAALTGGES